MPAPACAVAPALGEHEPAHGGKKPWRDPGDGPPEKGRDEPRCGGSDLSSRGELQQEMQGTGGYRAKSGSEERAEDPDIAEQHLLG